MQHRGIKTALQTFIKKVNLTMYLYRKTRSNSELNDDHKIKNDQLQNNIIPNEPTISAFFSFLDIFFSTSEDALLFFNNFNRRALSLYHKPEN